MLVFLSKVLFTLKQMTHPFIYVFHMAACTRGRAQAGWGLARQAEKVKPLWWYLLK